MRIAVPKLLIEAKSGYHKLGDWILLREGRDQQFDSVKDHPDWVVFSDVLTAADFQPGDFVEFPNIEITKAVVTFEDGPDGEVKVTCKFTPDAVTDDTATLAQSCAMRAIEYITKLLQGNGAEITDVDVKGQKRKKGKTK